MPVDVSLEDEQMEMGSWLANSSGISVRVSWSDDTSLASNIFALPGQWSFAHPDVHVGHGCCLEVPGEGMREEGIELVNPLVVHRSVYTAGRPSPRYDPTAAVEAGHPLGAVTAVL